MALHCWGPVAAAGEERTYGARGAGDGTEPFRSAAGTGTSISAAEEICAAAKPTVWILVYRIRHVRRHRGKVGFWTVGMDVVAGSVITFGTTVAETKDYEEEKQGAGNHAGEEAEKDGARGICGLVGFVLEWRGGVGGLS